MTVNISGFI